MDIIKDNKIYDSEIELFGHIRECEDLKKVKIEFVGGGFGYYNLDTTDNNCDFYVKILN